MLPGHDGIDTEPRHEEHHHPVEDGHGGEHGHEDEPEPEEDIYLLVDYVEGEDAEAVVLGDGARGPVLVKCALGHFGKHHVHGVSPVLGALGGHSEHIPSVGRKLVAEKTEDKEL